MLNKSKNAFSTVNVDELLGKEPEAEQEAAEPAPVIEKVSLNEIKKEQVAAEEEQITKEEQAAIDAVLKYIALTDEQRKAVDDALFE